MAETKKHPLFAAFLEHQRNETGFEDWSLEEWHHVATWEIWLQQRIEPSTTTVASA